jgi:hypothetical protein
MELEYAQLAEVAQPTCQARPTKTGKLQKALKFADAALFVGNSKGASYPVSR